MLSAMSFLRIAGLATLAGLGIIACSSDDDDGSTSSVATTAAAVQGAVDAHCTGTTTVEAAACQAAPEEETGDESGTSEYGPTRYNADSDDDDCKYHVAWKATPVGQNRDVSFTVTLTNKATGAPVTDAPVRLEIFLDEMTPAPNSSPKQTNGAPGEYTVGPVRFDKAGNWNVRFHFFENCNDNEHSPHGHAAFFVAVP